MKSNQRRADTKRSNIGIKNTGTKSTGTKNTGIKNIGTKSTGISNTRIPNIIIPILCFISIGALFLSASTVNAKEVEKSGCAISIAIDVSGSMKHTDQQRMAIEMIRLFIDVCEDVDYVNVTAYNDTIVYHSGLISMADEAAKTELLKQLNALEFAGETDNGLGLLQATKAITDNNCEVEQAFVLLITDGNTDLANSKTGRTLEDAKNDLYQSSELAKENNITIHAIEYTESYQEDTSLLSVITSATGGGTILVDNTPQFVQVMLSTFFSEYHKGKPSLEVLESTDLLNRTEFSVKTEQEKCYVIVVSTQAIQDSEILNESEVIEESRGDYYFFTEIPEEQNCKLSAVFSVSEPTTLVLGTIKIPVEEIPETEETSQTEEKEPEKESEIEPETQETVPVEIIEEKQPTFWQKYQSQMVTALIAGIAIITIIISVLIIRGLLFQKETKRKVFHGRLRARFISLKSKNESLDIEWQLSDYSGKGITLKELFAGKKIKEDLADLEKIYFYPGDISNEVIFVHNMEGGAFLGDMQIKANTKIRVQQGDIIYLSFAENASEIEIYYDV